MSPYEGREKHRVDVALLSKYMASGTGDAEPAPNCCPNRPNAPPESNSAGCARLSAKIELTGLSFGRMNGDGSIAFCRFSGLLLALVVPVRGRLLVDDEDEEDMELELVDELPPRKLKLELVVANLAFFKDDVMEKAEEEDDGEEDDEPAP